MEINQLLTPYNYNTGQSERIRYLVIHYVGATGSAKANCRYYASQYVGASAHYFIDFDGSIWQSVEDKNIAWHCGASKYIHPECRNANSISIELCVRNKGLKISTSKDWYFEDATVESAVELAKELMKKYQIPLDHVIRHYDVTGKICPNPYVYNHTKHTWEAFKKALESGKQSEGKWEKEEGRYRFFKKSKIYAADEWLIINHHWYLFGADGYMLTNWQKWNGRKVVSAAEPGDWYFFDHTFGGDLEGACWHSKENGAMEIWYVD